MTEAADKQNGTSRSWRQRLRPWFSALSLLSLLWVGWIFYRDYEKLRLGLHGINLYWILFIVISNCLSGYVAFEGFRLIFNRASRGRIGRLELGNLYFTSQLMKNLPGRFFGIIYQIGINEKESPAVWVAVNLINMALTIAFALFFAVVVWSSIYGAQLVITLFIFGAAIYAISWRKSTIRLFGIFSLVKKFSTAKEIENILTKVIESSSIFKVRLFLLFSSSWIIYLLSWAGYGMIWPNINAADGIYLCGIYTLAWFLGYVSFVTPSGLGVREAAFIFLAREYPPDVVAGMAVMGRVVFLAVDIIMGSVYMIIDKVKNER